MTALSGPVSICVDRPVLSLDRPFTYELPLDLGAGLGSLVELSFHGRRVRGWVLGPTEDLPRRVVSVTKLVSPVRFFDQRTLELARWISGRYVAPLATILGRLSPPRVVSEEEGWAGGGAGGARGAVAPLARPSPTPLRHGPPGDADTTPSGVLEGYRGGAEFLEAVGAGRGGFVVRPAAEDEVGVAVEAVGAALAGGRRAIVLVPEAAPVPATARAIADAFGDRVCLFLGGAKRVRYRTWLEILAGAYDVVVGTRPAVFAPVTDLGLIFVSRESHPGHREDRSPYFHVREVALARARIERATCAMSAVFPSVEAAALGAPVVEPQARRWPPVEVVKPGPEGRAPRLVAALRGARRAFVYAPLPGYGVAQVCRSCGEPAACAACGGVLRAEAGTIVCVVCAAPGRCSACGANDFGLRRGGAERVEEWTSRIAGVPVRPVAPGRDPDFATDGVVVGGPEAVHDVGRVGLNLVGILDADLAARRPGMSAQERALATWGEAAGWARPAGRVIVQSARPGDPAVQALVQGRPDRFHRAERERREAAGFPVGAPVFRVVGGPELPDALRRLEPITLLVSPDEGGTICLLALRPAQLGPFGELARSLAAGEATIRVEAEPHL